MNKIRVISATIIVTLVLFSTCVSSCSSTNTSQESNEDSIRRADSIAAIEAAEKAAEEARLDSIRQDSIDTVNKIIASIPSFKEIRDARYDTQDLLKLFRSRGFSASARKTQYTITEEEAGAEEPGTYTKYSPVIATLNINDKEVCKFQQLNEHGWGFKITINGAPEVLEQMKNNADASFKKDLAEYGWDGNYWKNSCRCTLKGNTLEYFIDQNGD